MGLRQYLRRLRNGYLARQPARQTERRLRSARPLLEILEDRTLLSVSLTGVPTWQAQGPTSINTGASNYTQVGAIESIAVEDVPVSGTNPGGVIVYAGTVNGGVWRTDNMIPPSSTANGMFTTNPSVDPSTISWRPLTDNEPSLATSSMALDPLDPSGNTLWVGTGSVSSVGGGGRPVGLLKTTDGGMTWTRLGLDLAGQRIEKVLPTANHEATGQVVLVACLDGNGIMRSSDGGQTFQSVANHPILGTPAPLTGTATDLIQDPVNADRFYAAIQGQGVYQSNDDGKTWTGILGGHADKLAATVVGGTTRLYVVDASFAAGEDDDFAISSARQGVFDPSSGYVDNFQFIGNINVPSPVHAPADISTGHFGVVADPTNPNVIYACGYEATNYRINVADGSWTFLNNAPLTAAGVRPSGSHTHGDLRTLVFLNNTTILIGDDGGIYGLTNPLTITSTDQKDLWIPLNGTIQDTEFFSIAYDTANGVIFGGSQDNATPTQTASGHWTTLGGGDGSLVAADNSSTPSINYYASDGDISLDQFGNPSSVFYANSTPVLLANAPNGTDGSGLSAWDQGAAEGGTIPFILNANNPKRMLLGNSDLYESEGTDSSHPAGEVLNDITPIMLSATGVLPGNSNGQTGLYHQITAMAYGTATNADAAYFADQDPNGVLNGQLFVRSTPGAPFRLVTAPWPGIDTNDLFAKKIVMDPNDYNFMYLVDNTNRIWRTTDAGSSSAGWTQLTDNLGALTNSINSLALYPGGTAGYGTLLVGGFGGVFRLILPGPGPLTSIPKWSLYGKGLPNVQVTAVQYIHDSDLLLVGTFGRGAWTITGAGNTLGLDGQLTVSATNSHIVLQNDPTLPAFAQVLINNKLVLEEPWNALPQITIDTRTGASGSDVNLIDINNVGQITSVTVSLGFGSNVVDVGAGGADLSPILGTVTVNGGLGSSTLNIDDQNNPVSANWLVNSTNVTRSTGSSITGDLVSVAVNYNFIENVIVNGGNGVNTFTVKNTGAITSFTVNTGFAIGNLVGVFNSAPLAALNIDSSNGPGGNVVRILDTGPGCTTTITGSTGDAVYLGDNGTLAGIQGPVMINDPQEYTKVTIDDSSDPNNHANVSLTATSLTGLTATGAPISFGADDLAGLGINGGTGVNTYTIVTTQNSGVPGGNLTTLNAGSAADTVNVQGTDGAGLTIAGQGSNVTTVNIGLSNSLAGIQSPVTLQSGPSPMKVAVNASADSSDFSNVMLSGGMTSSGSLTGLKGAAINFAGVGNAMTINAGNGNNTYTVSGGLFAQGTILNTGTGRAAIAVQATNYPLTIGSTGTQGAAVTVGDAGGVQHINGALTVLGTAANADLLFLNDQGDTGAGLTAARAVTVTSTSVIGLAPAAINFGASALAVLNVNGGNLSHGTTFTLGSTPTSATWNLSALGTGNTLVGPDSDSTWKFQLAQGAPQNVFTAAVPLGPVYFSGMQTVKGGSANDDFQFLGTGFNGSIDGGAGADTLDFTQFGSPVTVTTTGPGTIDGRQGTATGIGGTFNNINTLLGVSQTAASVVVTTLSDDVTHSGTSLRDAIATANANATNGLPTTITFASSLSGGTIILAQGVLELKAGTGSTTVSGGGQITVSGGFASGVFLVDSGASAVLTGLAIQHGTSDSGGGVTNNGSLTLSGDTLSGNSATSTTGGGGGGIYNHGALTLTNDMITGNSSTYYGGAIECFGGTMTMTNSTLAGNSSTSDGGGIYNYFGTLTLSNDTFSGNFTATTNNNGGAILNEGTLTLTNSTLAGNSAKGIGGGIFNYGGSTLTLTNDTLTGNSTRDGSGGAIYNSGALTVTASTLSANSAGGSAGGIYSDNQGTLTLESTIVAGNHAAGTDPANGGNDPDMTGAVTIAVNIASNNNLIGNGNGMSGISNGTSGNQVGNGGTPIDPLLSPLGDNGGPTQTVALQTGSPASAAGAAPNQLAGPISTTSATSFTVFNAAPYAGLPVIFIDNEQMLVTRVNVAAQTVSVQRGYNGTTAATHLSGSGVFLATDQRGVARLTTSPDIGAYQTVGVQTNPLLVTTASDAPSHAGVSLRDAVTVANQDAVFGTFAQAITFAPGMNGLTITLAQGVLELTAGAATTIIDGGGQITISGRSASGVFQVDSGANAIMHDLTIEQGMATSGGGVNNAGSLTLYNDTISGNAASGNGGGIYNTGTLALVTSTLSNNTAGGTGSGIFNGAGALSVRGNVVLQSTNPDSGLTTVSAGILHVDGTLTSPVTVGAGGTLDGNYGIVMGPLIVNGTLSSGDNNAPTSALDVANLSFGAGGALSSLLNGTHFGSGYDQVFQTVVGDTVNLTGATLNVSLGTGFTPSLGTKFDILPNRGALIGTFTGMPEGAIVTVGGNAFQITYVGGNSHHDVVLKVVTPTATTLTDNSPNPSSFGQAVSYTVNVTGGVPDGESVTLEDGSNTNAVIGTGSLTSGAATITLPTLSVGAHNIIAVYGGDASMAASQSSTIAQTVNQATPLLIWAAPSPINDHTPLGGDQLNASANIPGTFVYNPPAGTLLAAGTQTLSVTFTPADTTDFATATASVQVTVTQAVNQAPVFTSTASATFTVDALGSFTVAASGFPVPTLSENAADTLPSGVFFTPASGTLSGTPALGSVGTYTLHFTASNGIGSDAVQTFTLTVAKATPALTWTTPNPITYGIALDNTNELNASTSVAGTYVYTPPAGVILPAGTQTLSVTFTPTDTADYSTTTQTVQLTVTPAPLQVTANAQTMTYGSAVPALTYSASGFVNGETAAALTGNLTTTATSTSQVGSYPITQGTLADPNYNITFIGANLAVTQATAAPTALVITNQSATNLTAGGTVSFTLTAEDNTSHAVPSYTGTVQLTSTDSLANWGGNGLPTTYTFLSSDAGVHTFTISLATAGSQTITATDTANHLAAGTSPIAIVAGPFSKFVAGVFGGSAVVAGNSFLLTAQATDQFGNPVSGANVPTNITATASPLDPRGSFPLTAPVNSNGFAFFLGALQTAGSYTFTAAGSSTSVVVTPAGPTYFTVTEPASATTGNAISVTVKAFDRFGNPATSYTGTVNVTSTDPAATILVPSYTFVPGDLGAHTFNNVTLNTSTLGSTLGTTIIVRDTTATTPPIIGLSAPVTVQGLVVTGFQSTATGFMVTFSKPFTPADLTMFGPTGTVQDVTLTGAGVANITGNLNVPGTLYLDPTTPNTIVFKATSAFLDWLNSIADNGNDTESVALPDGTYTATLKSGTAGNGFLDALNTHLDGLANGAVAGGTANNYVATFTTTYQDDAHTNAHPTAVLSIPDFARGPDGSTAISVPNFKTTPGIPIVLYNAAGVTDATFTLTFNPQLLTPTAGTTADSTAAGSTFTMGTITSVDSTHATVSFTYHNATAKSGTAVLGDITATVPNSAASLYKTKELLALSGITVTPTPTNPVLAANGIHVDAYLGDVHVTAGPTLNTADALDVSTKVSTSGYSGFAAYSLLDPVIIANVFAGVNDGLGGLGTVVVNGSDVTALFSKAAGIPVPAIPNIPAAVTAVSVSGADPTLSLVGSVQTNGIVSVAVVLDDPHPHGSTGMTEAHLALTYDPAVLSVSRSDITLGSIPGLGAGWQITSEVDAATGQIGINLFNLARTPITATQAGSLVNIAFHVVPGAVVPATSVQLVNQVAPNGQRFVTDVDDNQGPLTLTFGLEALRTWPGLTYSQALPASEVAAQLNSLLYSNSPGQWAVDYCFVSVAGEADSSAEVLTETYQRAGHWLPLANRTLAMDQVFADMADLSGEGLLN